MPFSVFELFKIGVGPSSSHTMGPMTAAADFAARAAGLRPARVMAELFGSLALTGKGHATDGAVILGLCGERPEALDPDRAAVLVARVRVAGALPLAGGAEIVFDEGRDLLWHQRRRLSHHSNGMIFTALDTDGAVLLAETSYSIGGGAVVGEAEIARNAPPSALLDLPYRYATGAELLERAGTAGISIADLALANELAALPEAEVRSRLAAIRAAMSDCIDRGCRTGGELPGGLKVVRRAPLILALLRERQERMLADPLSVIDWVNLWALAVNEENAAGGRVVTAPTNGAAGIVPAVLRYYERFAPGASVAGSDTFLLAAAAIGALFKANASISGAEVGCQGEVGVACSMAAAGLTAALGGSNGQVENAAEIGMEHNLGLTCDPVGGLVQVPCIERNAVGAVKAIEASRLAMLGDGTHRVSLDQVIETMRRTGADMGEKYKETSLGGLAVNVVVC
ncbi:L-serine dehydratase [Polymorphobacter glacialis]|uniref:L-serine dehydratase n=1 Tax=Sandarakinorhabdus glacialis TaxID=1614636 RepID=A0A916ZL83_9SPHN|nr:L-serine ammonia-lyase [Polymorphobacter glacialis]GGE01659.1 L-serine dehydratase [Polymorphobacter glacialis]